MVYIVVILVVLVADLIIKAKILEIPEALFIKWCREVFGIDIKAIR